MCAKNAGILCKLFGVILPIDTKKKEEERETSVVVEGCRGGNEREQRQKACKPVKPGKCKRGEFCALYE
jgi:hypothetical protein